MNLTLSLFLLLAVTAPADLEQRDVSYCSDKSVNQDWRDLIAKYPEDKDLKYLHDLRLRLCSDVLQNKMILLEAISIFELERERIANDRE